MTRVEWRQRHAEVRAALLVRLPGESATPLCHPERPLKARSKCAECYGRWWTAQRRMPRDGVTA